MQLKFLTNLFTTAMCFVGNSPASREFNLAVPFSACMIGYAVASHTL